MRIVFVGAVDFSAHALRATLEQGGNVVGVLTPAVEAARFHSDYVDLAPVAAAWGVPTFRMHRIGDREAVERIRTLRPDIMFVFGFSQLIPPAVLRIPPLGCIGSHPALLPSHRGRHPLIWALVEGLGETGLTFFYLDEGVDSGDILWQRGFAIGPGDDAGTLYARIKKLAGEAVAEFLPQLTAGRAPRIAQDHRQATYWRRRREEDGEIRWNGSAITAHNLVRALTRPYVGAHTFVDDQRVRVWRSRLLGEGPLPGGVAALPGCVVATQASAVVVATGDGVLELIEWEMPGSLALKPGDRLGPRDGVTA